MTTFLLKNKIILVSPVLLCLFMVPVSPLSAAPSAANASPSLMLIGDLNETPQTAIVCNPLVIKYDVKNAGTVPVPSGKLEIEIKAADSGQSVFARNLPLTADVGSVTIEQVTFPQGAYTILLKAAVMTQEHGIGPEFTLAEQELTVSAPIVVIKSSDAIPRVLLWIDRNDTAVQQAFAAKIVKQAFEGDDVYYGTVDSEEDFTDRAMSGEFNTLVLFETDVLPERTDWLMDRISRGQGLVIIGSEDRTRMIAEIFGFRFREAPPAAGTMLLLTDKSGMGLSGTIAVSGRLLQPQKKSAKVAALFAGDKKPAMLIDEVGKGQVIVMPFSFTRSALDTGSTSIYSLLLRTAVRIAAPENGEQTGVSSIELLVSAPSGPIRTRIVETLPPETRVIWMNARGIEQNNTILYDLSADKEPKKLLSLYRIPAGSNTPAFTDVFFECNGKLMRQGKIE